MIEGRPPARIACGKCDKCRKAYSDGLESLRISTQRTNWKATVDGDQFDPDDDQRDAGQEMMNEMSFRHKDGSVSATNGEDSKAEVEDRMEERKLLWWMEDGMDEMDRKDEARKEKNKKAKEKRDEKKERMKKQVAQALRKATAKD